MLANLVCSSQEEAPAYGVSTQGVYSPPSCWVCLLPSTRLAWAPSPPSGIRTSALGAPTGCPPSAVSDSHCGHWPAFALQPVAGLRDASQLTEPHRWSRMFMKGLEQGSRQAGRKILRLHPDAACNDFVMYAKGEGAPVCWYLAILALQNIPRGARLADGLTETWQEKSHRPERCLHHGAGRHLRLKSGWSPSVTPS